MEPPRINTDDPAVQEACAAILWEVLHKPDREVWRLIVVGAVNWLAGSNSGVPQPLDFETIIRASEN